MFLMHNYPFQNAMMEYRDGQIGSQMDLMCKTGNCGLQIEIEGDQMSKDEQEEYYMIKN